MTGVNKQDVEAFTRLCSKHPGRPVVGRLDLTEFDLRDYGSVIPPLVTGVGSAAVPALLQAFRGWGSQACSVGLWSDGDLYFWIAKPIQ